MQPPPGPQQVHCKCHFRKGAAFVVAQIHAPAAISFAGHAPENLNTAGQCFILKSAPCTWRSSSN
eukprot:4487940-Prorocentrum_lima.AAC.1